MKRLLTMHKTFGVTETNFTMRALFLSVLLWAAALALLASEVRAASPEEDGIAVAIVYDTSGSMRESVRDANGKPAPKYRIANRALAAIVDRIQAFAAGTRSSGAARRIDCGLFVFSGRTGREAVHFAPFNPAPYHAWLAGYGGPDSATPLGTTIELASRTLLKSKYARKHLVVLTDGINTTGPDPAVVMPRIKTDAARQNTGISFHFVAFDVDAKVFDPLKKLGATVVGATDEKQLNGQLEFIFEKKILLEEEEPKPADTKPK